MGGLGVADTLGHDPVIQIVGKVGIAKIDHREGHGVNTGSLGIIAQFDLGFGHGIAVDIISLNVCFSSSAVIEVSITGALLTNGVGVAVGVEQDICGGHHQLVDHGSHFRRFIGDGGEILLHILTKQGSNTRHIGASHGSTRDGIVALTGDGRGNVTTVGSDLGLDLQAGGGTPGRVVGDERTSGLRGADGQLTAAGCCQLFTIVLADGADGNGGIAHIHLNIAGNIVVDDQCGSALSLGDSCLFFKGGVATGNQYDLIGHVQAGIVSGTACAGDQNIFVIDAVCVSSKEFCNEFLFFRNTVDGFGEVNNGFAVHQIGSGYAADGCDGHGSLISRRRANRAAIGVGGQRQVTILIGTVVGVIAVGSCNY